MFRFLEQLRKKPEIKRQKFVALASVAITLVIFAVWLGALFMRIHGGGLSFLPPEGDKEFFNSSSENLKESWGEFMERIDKATTAVKEEYQKQDSSNVAAVGSSTIASSTEPLDEAETAADAPITP